MRPTANAPEKDQTIDDKKQTNIVTMVKILENSLAN
jgi:hypothetical protein